MVTLAISRFVWAHTNMDLPLSFHNMANILGFAPSCFQGVTFFSAFCQSGVMATKGEVQRVSRVLCNSFV